MLKVKFVLLGKVDFRDTYKIKKIKKLLKLIQNLIYCYEPRDFRPVDEDEALVQRKDSDSVKLANRETEPSENGYHSMLPPINSMSMSYTESEHKPSRLQEDGDGVSTTLLSARNSHKANSAKWKSEKMAKIMQDSENCSKPTQEAG